MKLKYLLQVKTVKLQIIQTWQHNSSTKINNRKSCQILGLGSCYSAYRPLPNKPPWTRWWAWPKFWTISSHASNWNKIIKISQLQTIENIFFSTERSYENIESLPKLHPLNNQQKIKQHPNFEKISIISLDLLTILPYPEFSENVAKIKYLTSHHHLGEFPTGRYRSWFLMKLAENYLVNLVADFNPSEKY